LKLDGFEAIGYGDNDVTDFTRKLLLLLFIYLLQTTVGPVCSAEFVCARTETPRLKEKKSHHCSVGLYTS